VGERLTIRGLEVEVLEADERRISRLRVRVKPETVTEETDENQKQISAGKKN
jgi:Mg2+/Co2+ transporter CorC